MAAPQAGPGRAAPDASSARETRQDIPPPPPPHGEEEFQAGVRAALAGRQEQARQHFRNLATAEPQQAETWMWLAALTANTWEALSCLTRALELAPQDPLARQALRWVRGRLADGQALEPMRSPFVGDLVARARQAPEAAGPPPPPPEPAPKATRGGTLSQWLEHLRRLPGRLWAGLGAVALVLVLGLAVATIPGLGLDKDAAARPASLPTRAPEPAAEAWVQAQWPLVEEAREAGQWSQAIALLEEMRAAAPADALVREALLEAYIAQARALVAQGLLDEALRTVDRAVALRPQDPRVQQEREGAQLYMEGMERHQAGDWSGAAAALERVYAMDPAYRDVREMLYSAYLNEGLARRAAGDLGAARRALDRALEVYPEGEEARTLYREVFTLLFPTPTPTPATNKRIEVDISEQRLYAYEGDRLVYDFVVSTGGPSSPTAPGHYQVLDKIPMAYASTWNLKMPYWLGIYWVGNLENGIHALPILSNGEILWDGYLGQRVSFGCVILGTEAARLIYEWAEVGTPVIIRN
ncbi:MAG: tetratricopeptide repeat protein [Anaerolineae bacterium]|nr:tetratricopeptide repeat protein [Anaerolineae bacterium]